MMKTLNMNAPMGITGYGISGQYLFKELHNLGYDITLWPKGPAQVCTHEADVEPIKKAISQREKGFNPSAPFFNIWHQYDLMTHMGKGPYIAYSFFELNPLSERDILHMSIPDIMCVSSEWAAEITRRCVPSADVRILPCGVDTDTFKPSPSTVYNKRTTPNTYVFFNIGKWEKRKGHDILCSAFNKAFEPKDDVQLVLMPNNIFLKPEQRAYWHGMYTSSKLVSKIHMLTNLLPMHSNVADFINSVDCGVFPARSEGWNLELLESMACGKPVITTNVSAHTEYCSKENAYLVEAPNEEEAFDGTFFFGGGNWAELDIDEEEQIIEHMRYCYENRPSNPAGIKTANKFTWKNSARILDEIIQDSTLTVR